MIVWMLNVCVFTETDVAQDVPSTITIEDEERNFKRKWPQIYYWKKLLFIFIWKLW